MDLKTTFREWTPIECVNCGFTGVHGQLLVCIKVCKHVCPDCSGTKFKILTKES